LSYDELIQTPPLSRYSKKIAEKILNVRNAGRFLAEEASNRGMRAIVGRAGFINDGSAVVIYWLVDELDGIIVDAKFQVFGGPALIVAAETICELVIGKNYDQAKRIGVDLIDKKLRDRAESAAFPEESYPFLNLILEALDDASDKCKDIPLSETYVSPVPQIVEGEGYPGWLTLSHEQKLALLEEVLNSEVRPYVELDEGGIEIQELKENEIIIAYKGSCTSCFSAIGATLATIQQIVQAKVHSNLTVVPNMDALHL
jgi:NifU-like protein